LKIQIERIEFLKRLKVVEKTITENKIKPIISCAYIETRGDNLFFCGTNLETTITTEMKCKEVIESGKIVFQHQLVEEYLKELKDEFVVFSEIDGNLVIESSDSSSEFSLMNVEDFPKILVDEDFSQKEEIFKINSIELAEILEKVKYAASSSSDNLSINCVRMENENKKLKFITTDTYRLVYLEKEIEKINENIDVSIPLNTVEALTKLLRSIESTDISFYFINRQIFFKMKEVLVISRIIDMSFPNYKGILGNNSYNKKLTINAEVFLKMLKRITIFVRNNNETKSFFQINLPQTKKLYSTAINYFPNIENKYIVDAYSGTGTIAMMLSKKAEKVYAIELVESATLDGMKTARENGIENIEFINGAVEDKMLELINAGKRVDAIIFDPPRKGIEEKSLIKTAESGIKEIVYISCNPSTFARDAEILSRLGYKIDEVQPVDMFPGTSHTEVVGRFYK
jgi:DNA polymerase III subunit beta